MPTHVDSKCVVQIYQIENQQCHQFSKQLLRKPEEPVSRCTKAIHLTSALSLCMQGRCSTHAHASLRGTRIRHYKALSRYVCVYCVAPVSDDGAQVHQHHDSVPYTQTHDNIQRVHTQLRLSCGSAAARLRLGCGSAASRLRLCCCAARLRLGGGLAAA